MKSKSKIMDIVKLIILLLAVALISVYVTKIAHYKITESSVYAIREFNATFKVGNKIGLAVEEGVLNFGMIYPGGYATKQIIISHEYDFPLEVNVVYEGSIADILEDIPGFILEPHVEKTITFNAHAPYVGEQEYSGIVRIIFSK